MQSNAISKIIILISVFVLWLCPYRAVGDILSDRQQIESLIEAGNLTEAQTQIEQFKFDYSKDSGLPEALYWIAEKYRWGYKWEQATKLHNQIIKDYPDSPFSSKSRLGLARTEILSLINNQQYEQAEEAIGTLAADFSGHPDLPGTLYWTAHSYRWAYKYEKANELYQ